VAGPDRILSAYENALKKLADELIAEMDPNEDDRLHLMLVTQLLQSICRTYDSFNLKNSSGLEASKSVMYAAAEVEERRILNVPLRSLVESSSITPWHARFLNACIGMKRTVIVSGGENVGKSTLLNSLIDFLPRDQRVVMLDDSEDGLPALRGRSFTVELKAKRGTPSRQASFKKAMDMKPNWFVVGELSRREGPAFFEALAAGASGLATVQTPDPQVAMSDWLAMSKDAATHLADVEMIILHMVRDQAGRPRADRLYEVAVENDVLVMTPRRPS
jgi:type IV secretory pathway ATPase VirB11/archaellum biosynthesis ATPase